MEEHTTFEVMLMREFWHRNQTYICFAVGILLGGIVSEIRHPSSAILFAIGFLIGLLLGELTEELVKRVKYRRGK